MASSSSEQNTNQAGKACCVFDLFFLEIYLLIAKILGLMWLPGTIVLWKKCQLDVLADYFFLTFFQRKYAAAFMIIKKCSNKSSLF